MRHNHKFLGALFLAIGIFFLLRAFGILNFSVSSSLGRYWPVGLILVGVALMTRHRLLAIILLFITFLFAAVFLLAPIVPHETHSFSQDIALPENTPVIDLSLAYGAGTLSLNSGADSYAVRNRVTTSDFVDPKITNAGSNIRIERQQSSFPASQDSWSMELSPVVKYNLILDYGAAKASLDFRHLRIDSVKIDSGASDNQIWFNGYPTSMNLSAGASSWKIYIPNGYGVRIISDSGLSSTSFPGFTQSGNTFVNANYKQGQDNIEIKLSTGASSITVSYY